MPRSRVLKDPKSYPSQVLHPMGNESAVPSKRQQGLSFKNESE